MGSYTTYTSEWWSNSSGHAANKKMHKSFFVHIFVKSGLVCIKPIPIWPTWHLMQDE